MPQKYRRILDRNFSSRGGVPIARMVLHTSEGGGTALGLRDYFNQSGVEASSHKAVDQTGDSVTMVPDSEKAWTQAAYNPGSLSIEQIGYASTTHDQWVRGHHNQLCRVARILAGWSIAHDIPLRNSVAHGVCQHKDLGAEGGGHSDCGPGYPMKYVLHWARYFRHRRLKHPIRAKFYKRRVLRHQRRTKVVNPTVRFK